MRFFIGCLAVWCLGAGVASVQARAAQVPQVGPGHVIPADKPTIIMRDLSEATHPGAQEKILKMWEFVRELAGAPADIEPPVVYLASFDPAKEDPELAAWRLSWSAGYPEVDLPFAAEVKGYHYMKTNVIQVNPLSTYMRFYRAASDGRKKDLVGYGYYVTAHELLHYALEAAGVPGESHHCLILQPQGSDGKSHMERVIDFLAAEGIGSASLKFYGLREEQMKFPCQRMGNPVTSHEISRLRESARYLLTKKTMGSCKGVYADKTLGADLHPVISNMAPGQMSFIFQKPIPLAGFRDSLIGMRPAPETGADPEEAQARLDKLADVFEATLRGNDRVNIYRGVAAFSDGKKINEIRYVGAIDLDTRDVFIAGNGICRYPWSASGPS
jgi:hypothetical protein